MSYLPRRHVLQRVSRKVSPGLLAGILVPETYHFHSQWAQRNRWATIAASFSFWKHWWALPFRIQCQCQSNYHEKCSELDRRFRWFSSAFWPVSVLPRMAFFSFSFYIHFFLYPAILNDISCNNEFPKIEFDRQNFARAKSYPIMQNLSSISCRQAQSSSQPSLVCFGTQGQHKSIKGGQNL